MFEKKKLTLPQAKVQLETIYYPQLTDGIRDLSIDALVLAARDKSELMFLDVLGELQSEILMLQPMDLQFFFNKIIKIQNNGKLSKEDKSMLLIAMDRVASKRNKIVKLTLELKRLSNNFMAKRNWSQSKLKSCKSLFQFYQKLIEFVNFQELTVVPIIMELFVFQLNKEGVDE